MAWIELKYWEHLPSFQGTAISSNGSTLEMYYIYTEPGSEVQPAEEHGKGGAYMETMAFLLHLQPQSTNIFEQLMICLSSICYCHC